MKRFRLAAALGIAVALTTSPSSAVMITNAGFESPVEGDGGFTMSAPPGFSGAVGGIVGVFDPVDSFSTGTIWKSCPRLEKATRSHSFLPQTIRDQVALSQTTEPH